MSTLSPKSRRRLGVVALLSCLPAAGYAGEDYILPTLKGLLLLGIGLVAGAGLLFIACKALARALLRGESSADLVGADAAGRAPAPGGLRWGVVARVALLALPLNVVWLYVALTRAVPVVALLEQAVPVAWKGLLLGLLPGMLCAPHVVGAGLLWRSGRPSMALGVGLSAVLFVALCTLGLLALPKS